MKLDEEGTLRSTRRPKDCIVERTYLCTAKVRGIFRESYSSNFRFNSAILATFWLHSSYIMASLWLHSGHIVATISLYSTTIGLHSDYIPAFFD